MGLAGASLTVVAVVLWGISDWAARPILYLEPNDACIGIIEFVNETPTAYYCGSSKERGAERVHVPYGTTLQALLKKAGHKKN